MDQIREDEHVLQQAGEELNAALSTSKDLINKYGIVFIFIITGTFDWLAHADYAYKTGKARTSGIGVEWLFKKVFIFFFCLVVIHLMYLTRTPLHIRTHTQLQRQHLSHRIITQKFNILSLSSNLSGLSFHHLKPAQPNSETQTSDHIIPAHPHPQAPTSQLQTPYPLSPNLTSDPSNPSTMQHIKPLPLRSITMKHSPSKHSKNKFRR